MSYREISRSQMGGGEVALRVPRGIPEKPQDRKKVLIRLWGYLYRFKWMVLAAPSADGRQQPLRPGRSHLVRDGPSTPSARPGGVDFPVVFYYCGLMIAFYLLSSLLAYILSVLMIRLSQKVVFQMREDVFRRLWNCQCGISTAIRPATSSAASPTTSTR